MARIVVEKQFGVQSAILAKSWKSMTTSRSYAPGGSYESSAATLRGRRPAPAGGAPLFPPRKRLFMASLLFAFLFSQANWEAAAGCALLLLLFNTQILPWLDLEAMQSPPGLLLNKGGELLTNKGWGILANHGGGVILYPISVLALVLLYRYHLYVAAAAWAIMALGDGTATIIGEAARRSSVVENVQVRGPGPAWRREVAATLAGRIAAAWRRKIAATLPWNREKTWVGSLGLVLAGTAAAYLLTRWIAPAMPAYKTLMVCAAGALLGAVVEGLPLALDDNITVPLAAGAFMFCAFFMERTALASNLPYLGRRMFLALAVNLGFAFIAYAFKAASPSGACCGFLLGTAIYLGYGYKSFVLLFAFVLLGSVATRLGLQKKAARGIAERRGGARSWREASANLTAAAFFAILVITTHHEAAFLLAMVAALAEAAGDTISSEIGQWVSSRAYLITTFQRVSAGENGGVSLAGTAAGFAASASIVGLSVGLKLCGPYRIGGPAIAFAAAAMGNLFDSVLGATLERQGLVTNGMVNFAGTSVAGGLALGLALRWGL